MPMTDHQGACGHPSVYQSSRRTRTTGGNPWSLRSAHHLSLSVSTNGRAARLLHTVRVLRKASISSGSQLPSKQAAHSRAIGQSEAPSAVEGA